MENLDTLASSLQQHFSEPQKSERWSMYRLIIPIVDFANTSMNLDPYFEFNQTSSHGTNQSVDIALLEDNRKPQVMVEAKRANRRIAPEQIDKYLHKGVRGAVTNGSDWILCIDGRHIVVTIWDAKVKEVSLCSLRSVIDFLRGKIDDSASWSKFSQAYVVPGVKINKQPKTSKAKRISNEVTKAKSIKEFRAALKELDGPKEAEIEFLVALIDSIARAHGEIPSHCRFEFRSSRVSFFDQSGAGSSKRVGRIELGKREPDILVLTQLAASSEILNSIAPPRPHDKGGHMRRYRLPNIDAANSFGYALGTIIFSACAK
ncbi:hypothetical protein [Pseudoalteromonas sp. DY56-GL79]|uniref:hypothetical protein n=1 Tax=Pseudoalteromonas sp. DY56-GL79 TaxID=2967131 RepID=UPI00352A2346